MGAVVRERNELEYCVLYAVVVAGKSARFAEDAMRRLMMGHHNAPFAYIRRLIAKGMLDAALREARTGRYTVVTRAFTLLVNVDPATVSVDELQAIPGIGPKTARFFVVWTRPEERHAVLDVHVLRWLRARGHETPRQTPQSRMRYAELEAAFLAEADARDMTPRELDLLIWQKGSAR